MVKSHTWAARQARLLDKVHARLAAHARPATGFVSAPEPRTIGHFARGRQLIAGNFMLGGQLIEAPGRQIWEIGPLEPAQAAQLHGCAWLDDLAAVGDGKARERAQSWVFGWIDRYGGGQGPGWTPDLAGRRLIRWINHALFLLRGQDKTASDRFYASLTRQTIFLSRRWRSAGPGLPRFEALTGMIYAGLSLTGMEQHVDPAVKALAQDCKTQVDATGGIATRNPEELLDVFTLLTWAAQALAEADKLVPEAHLAAIARIAPTLRALRHADGGLARFHGGGRGLDGRLDHALATSGVKGRVSEALHMGFGRLAAGRTTVIIDASAPPKGAASGQGHASTLAFELTSGRRPVVVNCGSGASFGEEWSRAGRATASHSTLGIDGFSSARLGQTGAAANLLVDAPSRVPCEMSHHNDAQRIEVGHNGWQISHGLTHARTLDLTQDGRGLAGEDLLTTLSDGDKARFDRAMDATNLQGIGFSIRFHLHPEIEAAIDLGGTAISLALKSGEVWIFRADNSANMSLERSVSMESGRLAPRPSQQVVLSGRAMSYATRVRWFLAKAQDTPNALRDLAPEREAELNDADLTGE